MGLVGDESDKSGGPKGRGLLKSELRGWAVTTEARRGSRASIWRGRGNTGDGLDPMGCVVITGCTGRDSPEAKRFD